MMNTTGILYQKVRLFLEIHGIILPYNLKSILPNFFSRAMTHNKEDYPEPFEFRPERFLQDGKLNPNVRDPGAAFGFGRR